MRGLFFCCMKNPPEKLWLREFPQSTNPLRFLLFTSRPHKTQAILATSFVIIAAVLSSLISYIFKLIVNAATTVSTSHDFQPLIHAVELWVVIQLGSEIVWRFAAFAAAYWADGVRATSRDTLVSYITLHSRTYFTDHFAGSLNNKINHAANGSREMINLFLWNFLQFFVSLIMAVILAATVSFTVAALFVVWAIVVIIANMFFAKWRAPRLYASQMIDTKLTGRIVDLLTNIAAMQEYARRTYEIGSLRTLLNERRLSSIRNWHDSEKMRVVNSIFQASFAAAMLYLVVHLMIIGSITVGDITLIISLIFLLEGQMLFIGSRINDLSEKWSETEESLDEILDPHEIVDTPGAAELHVDRGEIHFNNVSFAYHEKKVLEHFDLFIKAHERVGLVGLSGAGKSTIMRLLLRNYEIKKGSITIDDTNIASVTQDSLHRVCAVVPQESVLFHRTIEENIAYGKPDATREEVQQAAELAYAHGFISRLPQGYDALVGERGVKLSGGERQRIAIARAILKNAPILLLDEATSALDSESEVEIQRALHELMRGKTVIAIAHRLSTLREMDRIVVLDQGVIVEEGTHENLLKQGGIYARLWNHQAGGFLVEEE